MGLDNFQEITTNLNQFIGACFSEFLTFPITEDLNLVTVAKMELRTDPSSGSVVHTLTIANSGITVTPGTTELTNKIDLLIPSSITSAFLEGKLIGDLKLFFGATDCDQIVHRYILFYCKSTTL